jgi:hypothetical protein
VNPPLERLVRRIAAFGLPQRVGFDPMPTARQAMAPVAAEVLDDELWRALLGTVGRARLVGFLQAAIDAGAMPVTEQQRSEAADLHLEWCAALLGLERALLEAVDGLDAAGIDVIVLKGSAHAHLLYPNPSWRMFGDNDLLIRTEAFDDAVRILQAAGYERPVPQARPGFDARFGKGATLRRPVNEELDLHRTLLFGSFGLLIDLDELFASSVTFEVGGRTLQALGPETRLLHACYHAGLGDPIPRLASVRDIAQQLANGSHDPCRVLELARDWQSLVVIARGLTLCRSQLEVDVEGPLADAVAGYVPSRQEWRAVDSYVGDHRRFARKVLATLPYVDGLGAKLAFLRAAVAPRREFAQALGSGGTLVWLRRGCAALTRTRRH